MEVYNRLDSMESPLIKALTKDEHKQRRRQIRRLLNTSDGQALLAFLKDQTVHNRLRIMTYTDAQKAQLDLAVKEGQCEVFFMLNKIATTEEKEDE